MHLQVFTNKLARQVLTQISARNPNRKMNPIGFDVILQILLT
jgi:hypothetical protein